MQINHRKVSIIILLSVFVIVFIGYKSYVKDRGARNVFDSAAIDHSSDLSTPSTMNHQTPKHQAEASEPINEKINTDSAKENSIALTPAETGELKSWVTARGYFSWKDAEIYETYSNQVLDELGKQGDIKALNILTSRMVRSGDMSAAIRYANMNIVLGSTTALDTLTIFTLPPVLEKNATKIRSAILETLAVAQVMNLRGDRTLANVSMHDTVSTYKIRYEADLTLTDAEQQFVEKRGQELYDAYQQIRRDKGLGDFDNEDPSPVKRFFESIFGAK